MTCHDYDVIEWVWVCDTSLFMNMMLFKTTETLKQGKNSIQKLSIQVN